MENKELRKSYIDEKTGIEYRLVGDYYVPNLILKKEEKIIFGGRLGQYKYYDMDAVIAEALKLSNNIL